MDGIFQRNLTILPSIADASARLGIPDTFALFMDAATEHADALGIGAEPMFRRKLFWLTVKTQIVFHRRPRLNEAVTVTTWPEKPEHMRCIRYYELTKGDELLAAGKTEWALLDTGTGQLHPMDVYPPELAPDRPASCPEPFAKIPKEFDQNSELLEEYRVRSTDIDLGGHMNNAAYVRALAGAFSNAEWETLHIRQIDVLFRASCYEGDVLQIRKRHSGDAIDLCMSKDDKIIVLARLQSQSDDC